MSLKKTLEGLLKSHRYKGVCKGYLNLYRKIERQNPGITTTPCEGEMEWLNRWRKYDKNVSVCSYRIFQKYIGNELNIMPLELCAGMVEPVLNPENYRAYYNDKNAYDLIFKDFKRPAAWLRNINGICYNCDYKVVDAVSFEFGSIDCDALIVKPTRDCSGHGVRMFEKRGTVFVDKEGTVLDGKFLQSTYRENFIIQSRLKQHVYMSQFNETSLNTLRVVTYRSVKNGQVHVIDSMIRIGAKGACVDNAHAGGMFVGIDVNNGKLGKYACNWLGETKNTFNDIRFDTNEFIIPNFEAVKDFAVRVSENIIHQNLVALDIALDENGEPVFIETNCGGFGAWPFQFTTGPVFGEFSDEIMEHCFGEYKKLNAAIEFNKHK